MRPAVRFSRPVGSKEPFTFRHERPVAFKEVFIGNHAPGDHYAPVAQSWVPEKELYDNRRR